MKLTQHGRSPFRTWLRGKHTKPPKRPFIVRVYFKVKENHTPLFCLLDAFNDSRAVVEINLKYFEQLKTVWLLHFNMKKWAVWGEWKLSDFMFWIYCVQDLMLKDLTIYFQFYLLFSGISLHFKHHQRWAWSLLI